MTTPSEVGKYLGQIASRSETINYAELAAQFGLPKPDGAWTSHPLAPIFEVLDREDANADRPFRTAVVVKRDTGVPGAGFFESLSTLRGIPLPMTQAGRDSVWVQEIKELFAAHGGEAV